MVRTNHVVALWRGSVCMYSVILFSHDRVSLSYRFGYLFGSRINGADADDSRRSRSPRENIWKVVGRDVVYRIRWNSSIHAWSNSRDSLLRASHNSHWRHARTPRVGTNVKKEKKRYIKEILLIADLFAKSSFARSLSLLVANSRIAMIMLIRKL